MQSRKEKKLKNKNVLCCINENPLFSYRSLENENNTMFVQTIINFVTENSKNKNERWLKKESAYESNVAFIYYEVNVQKALLFLKNHPKKKWTEIEKFCFTLLNYILEETPENLMTFLANTKTLKEKELEKLKKTFQ